MSTFDDLYRARLGAVSQEENFLTAATGFLVNASPDAAHAIVRALGGEPTGRVWSNGQEGLFDLSSGASVGRADLVLRWCAAGTLRQLVVEAKLDAKVENEQLERYARGLGSTARVVLLARDLPAVLPAGITGYSWDCLREKLAPLAATEGPAGALVRQWITLAQDLGALRRARIDREQASQGMRAAVAVEEVHAWLARVLPFVLPSSVRARVIPLIKQPHGQPDEDVGWFAEWDRRESVARGRLAFHGLGIAATASPLGGLAWRCEVVPRNGVIEKALLRDQTLPWRPQGGGWLSADVGFTEGDLALDAAAAQVVARCRAVLRAPAGLGDAEGFWKGPKEGPFQVPANARPVEDVVRDIGWSRALRGAEDTLVRGLLDALRARVEAAGPRCRRVHYPLSRFYTEDGQLQTGAWLDLSHQERPLVVWAWYPRRARTNARLAATLPGWDVWPDPAHPNTVYAAPAAPPEVLDSVGLAELAAAVAPFLVG